MWYHSRYLEILVVQGTMDRCLMIQVSYLAYLFSVEYLIYVPFFSGGAGKDNLSETSLQSQEKFPR